MREAKDMQRGDIVTYVSESGREYPAMVQRTGDDDAVNLIYAGTCTENGVPLYVDGMGGHYYKPHVAPAVTPDESVATDTQASTAEASTEPEGRADVDASADTTTTA